LTASRKRHDLALNYDLYHNRRFADMTMYPGGAAPMYMVTWPDVATLNTGLALTDNIGLTENQQVRLSAKVAWQHQRLNNDEGYHALKVFFPAMTNAYYQTTGRVAASYRVQTGGLQISVGAGWGSRAPTVTEAYGYYLNNTFDQFDYIGNPHLKNESATELNAALKWRGGTLQVGIDGNAFLFRDYIIGHLETRLSAMTVDAEGVKVYGNIKRATIANASVTAEWQPLQWLNWNGKLSVGSGRDADNDPLPLISPVGWQTQIGASRGQWQAQITVRGNARQSRYADKYGETETPAWTICNLSALWQKPFGDKRLSVRAGVENLFDKRYATYADWNQIPQKGRNIFANLTFEM
ncbi:MAG: TonB-dependent receptor, partial [Salinivirgaceae bacterium]|nr:TonB-dependent receptor [Salinivirgaceae bacterium]